MIDLKQWVDRNANRPLAYAIGTVLCLQVGYLAYLAHDEYAARLHRIERVVESASLGIQQDNRPLIEATLITGLRNSDAATVALCRAGEVNLLYPPSNENPCRTTRGGLLHWTIRRKAVGLDTYEFVFVINRLHAFAPLAVLLAIMAALSLAVVLILLRARKRFTVEILDPLRQGLNAEEPLGISELDELRRKNLEHIALSRRQAVSEALFELSAQVAHDIRSPLAALEVAAGSLAQLPEKKRLMVRSAVVRIRDIANSLLDRHRAQAGNSTTAGIASEAQLLSSLIDPVVSEKRLQFRPRSRVEIELRLDASSYGLFAAVQPVEFKRLLSNLVNNAVEAFGEDAGTVGVGLSSRDGRALVSVQDSGKGIPPEILAKLGRRGQTHGKAGGSGLGLHHAQTNAASWGGSLEIASEVGKGTTATVFLPLAAAPDWFVPELQLSPSKTVVILDDDESIHQVWQGRLDALKAGEQDIEVVHISTPAEMRAWVKGNEDKALQALYLFDYEFLGYRETGLTLADELSLGQRVVLVTSRYDEPEVLAGCRRLKARLIPKGLAGSVPMRVGTAAPAETPERARLDAVLIDDDPLTTMVWENAASDFGKRLRTFSTPGEFFKEAGEIDRATPVYVDSNLGEGVDGGEESLRVHEMGFDEVYLTTGHEPGRFHQLKHLSGVIGKEPPWGGA
jgi:signal transduction histidine kinase